MRETQKEDKAKEGKLTVVQRMKVTGDPLPYSQQNQLTRLEVS